MDIWYWMTGALLFAVSAICGAILIREWMRKQALEAYEFRREEAYRQIIHERDEWIKLYEWEHGERIACEATIRVQNIILGRTKVARMGGRK